MVFCFFAGGGAAISMDVDYSTHYRVNDEDSERVKSREEEEL